MSSDEQLSARAARGDARAFEAIFRRYHQDLYRFCLSMVGDADDAQDTLQNTMVKVMRALPGERRRIQLRPWLYRIARNESIETLRKRRDESQLESQQSTEAGPAESAETRARLRQLLSDLEQLPGRQRAVLTMRELAGLSYAEIAAALDCSEAVARQALYEARVSLRQMEAGREMGCKGVMRELSDSDGRVTRRREIQAHLRSCPDCQAFQQEIDDRNRDLAALAPLPVAASAGLIESLLAQQAGAGAGAGAGVAGGNAAGALTVAGGKTIAASAVVKTVATVAAVAAIGIGAERGGLVDLGGSGTGADVQRAGGAPAPGDPEVPGGALGSDKQAARERGSGSSPPQGPRSSRGEQRDSLHGGQADAVPPGSLNSTSRSGAAPSGGGHGRSAAENGGRPDGLPAAAGNGQQTANANKPAGAGKPESAGKPEAAGTPPQAKATPPPVADPPSPPAAKPPSPPTTKPEAPPASGRSVQPPPDPA